MQLLGAYVLLCSWALANAALIPNYFGSGDWTDASLWQNSVVPTSEDETWMNTDNTICTISSTPAAVEKLIVARKSQDTKLIVANDLTIGSLFFMGQYVDNSGVPADGTVEVQKGQVLVLAGEMAVGVSAEGVYDQMGGSTVVHAQCKIGRYNKVEAIGRVELQAGSMSCDYLYINPYSVINLNGGVLRLPGNKQAQVQTYVSNQQIDTTQLVIRIRDNGARTLVYAVDPTTKKTLPNFFGGDFFDPSNFQGAGLPNIDDEVWMNTANAYAAIGKKQVAMVRHLIVGRHAPGVDLELLDGGELYIGDEDSRGILFAGQYGDGSGSITLNDGSLVTVHGEVAIGVSGAGMLTMLGGKMTVHGRLKIGRYNVAAAVGVVEMTGGLITCDNFEMNDFSDFSMEGGTIVVNRNVKSRVQQYIASGKFNSLGRIKVEYDRATIKTTITVDPWDILGFLDFTESEVGPILPQIVRDATNRRMVPVPQLGSHPRIFFGSSEIPSIRTRLSNTESVMAVETMKQFEVYSVSMRLGRAAYNALPDETKKLPSGKQRISNPGLFDTSTTFNELKAGITTNLASQTGTHRNALAGVMAIESFYCVIWDGVNSDVPQRAADLAAAMDTWSQWAVANPDFDETTRDLGGGQHMAFAYDMLFNFMSTSQQANVRNCIAKMIWDESRFKAHLITPHAVQSNWVTLNSFVSAMVMAIEGDVTNPSADFGWSNERLTSYFRKIMIANYNFLTYGWYSNGEPYEGMGKNYQYNIMMVAYAKRGYNFFTHPHVQAYAFDFLVAQMQPFGHYITIYDAIGGSGWDPELGGHLHKDVDIIGLQYAFKGHPAVNFAYRNFVETPYGEGLIQHSVDADKVSVRSTYKNSFLALLIMGDDYDESEDFISQNQKSRDTLTFAGIERGLIITNSDYSQDALQLQFHIRQDMGGHTMADRNNFVLSGLGRVWIRLPVGYLYDTEWANGILVDDAGIPVTYLDGTKARQPGRLAHLQDEASATFMTGDATYAYNTEWYWSRRLPGSDYTRPGFSPVTETWNDFRRGDNTIPYSFGDISFYNYPHWWEGGYLERCVKKTANDMKQVYRLAGMVRGPHPYALIVDDLEKSSGGVGTNYKWITQIPEDLVMMPSNEYPAELDPSRDAVLTEISGNRNLLIRILNADGSQPSGNPYDFDETITYYQWGANRMAKRFIIERLSQLPRFRILIYPFVDGGVVPLHSEDANGDIVADWGQNQRDTLVFTSQFDSVGGEMVEITGLTITRDTDVLIDTLNQVEPNPIRS